MQINSTVHRLLQAKGIYKFCYTTEQVLHLDDFHLCEWLLQQDEACLTCDRVVVSSQSFHGTCIHASICVAVILNTVFLFSVHQIYVIFFLKIMCHRGIIHRGIFYVLQARNLVVCEERTPFIVH